MIVLAGGDLVLPDRILGSASLVLDESRITAIDHRSRIDPSGADIVDVTGCYVVPGFIDVHVHGTEGTDTLDGRGSVSRIASRLPRYGVTAFCPTTVACAPGELRVFLEEIAAIRAQGPVNAARVLPAHMESNFINPEFRGAQPATCLRVPRLLGAGDSRAARPSSAPHKGAPRSEEAFTAQDILDVIEGARPDVGIVTLAPEIDGGLDLVRSLVNAGHRVSLGHSGADFEIAMAAIEAGARHATHLFNRMPPLGHRAPGLAGAVLAHQDVAAELICDGFHVHPAMSRVAIAAKGVQGIMAITDGTAAAGLPIDASARLGGRTIRAGKEAAFLEDGTLAGSTLTMDRAFRQIVSGFGASIVDAAAMCATTPARQMGLTGFGVIAEGAWADLVVLDRGFQVQRTFIAGREVYAGVIA
jgi:N-acetylglucosamine-6-phosphate deacetylase